MIKIWIEPDRLGNLSLYPVSKKVAKRISESNAYDGSHDVYLQRDYDIEEFLKELTPAQRKNIKGGWCVCKLIDEWTFRHMVGGCCD